jgi:succinyl-CoA synthetase beta subunit
MDIEEVAHKTPELIITEPFDPDRGLSAWQTRLLSARLGLPAASWRAAEQFFKAAARPS